MKTIRDCATKRCIYGEKWKRFCQWARDHVGFEIGDREIGNREVNESEEAYLFGCWERL